jgi:shikimate kinase
MKHIYLIGYRCTGKTSVGRLLSKKLGWDFVDADEVLVKDAEMKVAEIVQRFGWDDFRNRETRILKSISRMDRKVVATGGGVILRDENIETMRTSGTVVWLKASVETIARRMAGDEKTGDLRPGLTDKGPVKEIEETLDFRLPMYGKSMDFSIETDGIPVNEICDLILEKLSHI